MFEEIFWLVLLIALNLVVCYTYKFNKFFPVLFSMFGIIYGLSIIELNELFVSFCMIFCVLYNLFVINEQRSYKYV